VLIGRWVLIEMRIGCLVMIGLLVGCCALIRSRLLGFGRKWRPLIYNAGFRETADWKLWLLTQLADH
jgi:hypothetical protein